MSKSNVWSILSLKGNEFSDFTKCVIFLNYIQGSIKYKGLSVSNYTFKIKNLKITK